MLLSKANETGDLNAEASAISAPTPVVELVQLSCALAVADELHFTRAADKLRMDQSAVSRHIQKLEWALGVQIFKRNKRQVELTDAGHALLPYAQKCLGYARVGVARAVAAGRGEPAELRIGYMPFVDVHLIARMKTLADKAALRVPVRFTSLAADEIFTMLRDVRCHVGLVVMPVPDELTAARLSREQLMVALPARHRLAHRRRIEVRDLRDDPVIWVPREMHRAFVDRLIRDFNRAGYIANFSREAQSVSEALGLVGEGFGVTFVKTSEMRLHYNGLVVRPLVEQFLTVETGLAYFGENRWSFLQEFIRLVTNHLGSREVQRDAI